METRNEDEIVKENERNVSIENFTEMKIKIDFKKGRLSSSSCSLRVRCIPYSLILKVELVPPSLLRSSYVPSSFWSIS